MAISNVQSSTEMPSPNELQNHGGLFEEELTILNCNVDPMEGFEAITRINLKSKATFLRCVASFWQRNANVALLFSVHHRIDML